MDVEIGSENGIATMVSSGTATALCAGLVSLLRTAGNVSSSVVNEKRVGVVRRMPEREVMDVSRATL